MSNEDTKDCTRLPVVARYDVGLNDDYCGCGAAYGVMDVEADDGCYVMFADHQALIAELQSKLDDPDYPPKHARRLIAELRAENERLIRVCADIDSEKREIEHKMDYFKLKSAPARQVTDGGRNPRYEGLSEGETEDQRVERLNPAPADHLPDYAEMGDPKCGHPTCKDLGEPHPFCEFVAAQAVADEREADPIFDFLLGAGPLCGAWFGETPDGAKPYWWREHLRKARAALSPAEQPGQVWIPLSERLPGVDDLCLIKIPVGTRSFNVEGAKYIGDGKFHGAWCSTHGAGAAYHVSHWLPAAALLATSQEQSE